MRRSQPGLGILSSVIAPVKPATGAGGCDQAYTCRKRLETGLRQIQSTAQTMDQPYSQEFSQVGPWTRLGGEFE